MIKYYFILVLGLMVCSCKPDATSNSTDNSSPKETTANSTASDDQPKHVKASDIAPFIGLWEYTVIISDDLARKKDYEGRWIQFGADQTFTSGKWADQSNSGNFDYDNNSKIIKLYYKNQKDATNDWKTKIDGDVMIFMGNGDINETGDQIRLARTTERPQDIQ